MRVRCPAISRTPTIRANRSRPVTPRRSRIACRWFCSVDSLTPIRPAMASLLPPLQHSSSTSRWRGVSSSSTSAIHGISDSRTTNPSTGSAGFGHSSRGRLSGLALSVLGSGFGSVIRPRDPSRAGGAAEEERFGSWGVRSMPQPSVPPPAFSSHLSRIARNSRNLPDLCRSGNPQHQIPNDPSPWARTFFCAIPCVHTKEGLFSDCSEQFRTS